MTSSVGPVGRGARHREAREVVAGVRASDGNTTPRPSIEAGGSEQKQRLCIIDGCFTFGPVRRGMCSDHFAEWAEGRVIDFPITAYKAQVWVEVPPNADVSGLASAIEAAVRGIAPIERVHHVRVSPLKALPKEEG